MPSTRRNSYSFKEGLTMMAAKVVGIDPELAAAAGESARAVINSIRNAQKKEVGKDRERYIREAQSELHNISAETHGPLVNALNAKLLALQGRGSDTEIAHVAPGEVVIPREMQTAELLQFIAAEAAKRGIDPRRLVIGEQSSVNPTTGVEEFSLPPARLVPGLDYIIPNRGFDIDEALRRLERGDPSIIEMLPDEGVRELHRRMWKTAPPLRFERPPPVMQPPNINFEDESK